MWEKRFFECVVAWGEKKLGGVWGGGGDGGGGGGHFSGV